MYFSLQGFNSVESQTSCHSAAKAQIIRSEFLIQLNWYKQGLSRSCSTILKPTAGTAILRDQLTTRNSLTVFATIFRLRD